MCEAPKTAISSINCEYRSGHDSRVKHLPENENEGSTHSDCHEQSPVGTTRVGYVSACKGAFILSCHGDSSR